MAKSAKSFATNLSVEQDYKLIGASEILKVYQTPSIESLKANFITFNDQSLLLTAYKNYPFISDDSFATLFSALELKNYETQCFDNLYQHLRYLQLEFIEQSELNFYHTLLIVLLRRGYEVTTTFNTFQLLWQSQADYLFEHLSLRWLVSAVDTFIDFSSNPMRRAILMNVISLINTLKAYETQQYVFVSDEQPDKTKIEALSKRHHALYDGLTYLRLGCDDTIEQMRRRFLTFIDEDTFATQFLLKIFDRLHDNPTAYAFFKHLHTEDWGYNWEI